MASTLGYASVVDLENFLLIDVVSSFESQVETWISAAEEYVDNFLGFTTASGLWNESITGEISEVRVDGDLNLIIQPRKRPINSVSQIQIIKGTDSFTLTLTDGGETKYQIPTPSWEIVYPNGEISTSGSVSITSFADIKFSRFYTKINYIAGYTSIPKIVSLATTMLAADTVMRQANKEGLTAITQGKISKRWSERKDGKSEWILDAEEYLKPYRISSGWV